MAKIVKTKEAKRVETKNASGKPNGFLLELVSERDNFTRQIKGQMYLTVANPGEIKGYHLHALADYYVICVKGRVKEIVYRDKNTKEEVEMGEGDFKLMELSRGYPHAIQNIGNEPSYSLIYRYPAWDPKVQEQLDIDPANIETDEAWRKIEQFKKQFDSK
jgi:dTDP-4-dehydrorhamnose 3,5-epimerase-like enzyme